MTLQSILIADDDRELVQLLSAHCERVGFEVRRAYSGQQAWEMLVDNPPGIACLDIEMPPGNGLGVIEMISGDRRFVEMPVVVFSGNRDHHLVKRCRALGAHYLSKDPGMFRELMPLLQSWRDRLGSALRPPASAQETEGAQATEGTLSPPRQGAVRARSPRNQNALIDAVFAALRVDDTLLPSEARTGEEMQIPWVLTIDDDPDFSWSLKKRLEAYGVAVVRAYDGTEGYRTAFTRPADLITLDYEMPNGQGDYVLRRLKENPVTRSIPVIVLTGKRDRALERKMINLGATRFMNKPYVFEELLAEMRKHIHLLPGAVEFADAGVADEAKP